MISANRFTQLRPIPEKLRLYDNTISDDDDLSLKDYSSRFAFNDLVSQSGTSSESIDDIPQIPTKLVCVPSLELASRDSSIYAAPDPFKRHPNINLRSDSDEEVSSESINSEFIAEPTPAEKWKQLNKRLQQMEEERKRLKREANRLGKSIVDVKSTSGSKGALAYGKEYRAGRSISSKSAERLPSIDYIEANKNVQARKQKQSGYSYQMLHQIKNPDNSVYPHTVNLFDEPLELSSRTRARHKSDISMDHVISARAKARGRSEELSIDSKAEENEPNSIRTKEQKGTKKKKRWKSITGYCLYPRTPTSPLRRFSQLDHVNPDDPEKSYYVHSISPTGVHRLSQKQQADLEKAHQTFCEKHPKSYTKPLFSRLDTQFRPLNLPDRTSSARCASYSQYLEPLFPDPFVSRRPRRAESLQTVDRYHRYNTHDYSLLPNVFNQARSLGPDLESEEYKAKLAKRSRQKSYGDRIREHAVRRRSSKSTSKLIPTYDPTEEVERDVLSSGLSRSNDDQRTLQLDDDGGIISLMDTAPSPKLKTKKRNLHKFNEELEITERSVVPGNITFEDVERRNAAKKREAMLSYANRVQTKFKDMRKKKAITVPYKQLPLSTNELEPEITEYSTQDTLSRAARLKELLKRHEEDREFAESIQKSLMIKP